jgi:hypothetical protein
MPVYCHTFLGPYFMLGDDYYLSFHVLGSLQVVIVVTCYDTVVFGDFSVHVFFREP